MDCRITINRQYANANHASICYTVLKINNLHGYLIVFIQSCTPDTEWLVHVNEGEYRKLSPSLTNLITLLALNKFRLIWQYITSLWRSPWVCQCFPHYNSLSVNPCFESGCMLSKHKYRTDKINLIMWMKSDKAFVLLLFLSSRSICSLHDCAH